MSDSRFFSGLGTVFLEILRLLGRLADFQTEDQTKARYYGLVSAIDQLSRGQTHSLVFNESYLSRLDTATPEMLAKALADCGFTSADVERWRREHPSELSAAIGSQPKETA